MSAQDGMDLNRLNWDESVPMHFRSPMYRHYMAQIEAGGHCLDPRIVEEVGDVAGKSLLHPQCHFGLDTLSWVRLGARATGIDFSPPAIELARKLSAQYGLPARFECCNVYDTPDVIEQRFDVVFTSMGVLCWLPDLARWAGVVAAMLKPGGLFYLMETHPVIEVLDDADHAQGVAVVHDYFRTEPARYEGVDDYAGPEQHRERTVAMEWRHTLGSTLNALIDAGLTIERFNEHTTLPYRRYKVMQEVEPWRFDMPGELRGRLPLRFSLRARKNS